MTKLTARQKADLMEELTGLKRFSVSLTGDSHDADDLLQLTIERVLEKGMPADAHAGKWSYRVCRNLWLDELRARDVRTRHAKAELAGNGDLGVSTADGLSRLEFERASRRCPAYLKSSARITTGGSRGALLRRSGGDP